MTLAWTWACGWARLGRAHSRAGQGCGELETGPAVALLGQGLVALGGEMGSWAMGRVEGALRGWAGTGRSVGALKALTAMKGTCQ